MSGVKDISPELKKQKQSHNKFQHERKKTYFIFLFYDMVDEQAVSPSFKMGSVLTVEFQRWLLNKLKNLVFKLQ